MIYFVVPINEILNKLMLMILSIFQINNLKLDVFNNFIIILI